MSEMIAIAKIDASNRLRTLDPNWVDTLAEDFVVEGHMTPIEVVAIRDGYRLVFGGHRLAAATKLGWTEIKADVQTLDAFLDESRMRLREIKENVLSRGLSTLDRAVNLAEWKAIYEAANRTAGHGGKRRSAAAEIKWQDFATRFSTAAANALDISERSVRLAVQIASGIDKTIRDRIALHPIADNQSELQQLAQEPPARQASIVGVLLSDPPQAGTVGEAIAVIDRVPRPRAVPAYEKLSEKFGRLKDKDQRAFFALHRDAIEAWLAEAR